MSSMLEQAIIDAAALREAALKNAEQSLIEKYAPQIKEAVESMLEGEDGPHKYKRGDKAKHDGKIVEITTESDEGMVGISSEGTTYLVNETELQQLSEDDILQEEEAMAASAPSPSIEAPFSGNPNIQPNQKVEFSVNVEEFDDMLSINLDDLEKELSGENMPEEDKVSIGDMADEETGMDSLLGDLDNEEETPNIEPEENEAEDQLAELLDLLNEMDGDIIEEEAHADMAATKAGHFTTDIGHQTYEADLQAAADALNEEDEEDLEEEEDRTVELQETIDLLKSQNEKLETVVYKLSDKLEETLLSNAKLLYQNRTLCDASLNERQKDKIVEAIAKAESPKEAKHLQETLSTTVGSSTKKAPKSLNESVNNRPNLSGMLSGRQNLNESQTSDPFKEKMKKLAGIK